MFGIIYAILCSFFEVLQKFRFDILRSKVQSPNPAKQIKRKSKKIENLKDKLGENRAKVETRKQGDF